MIWIIIAVLFFIVFNIYCFMQKHEPASVKIVSFVFSIFISMLIYILPSFICEGILIVKNYENIEYTNIIKTEQIYSADYLTNPNDFSIKLGKFDNNELYYVYTIKNELGYNLSKIKANDCIMKHTDDTPQLVFIEGSLKTDKFWDIDGQAVGPTITLMYVPSNTVITDFIIE